MQACCARANVAWVLVVRLCELRTVSFLFCYFSGLFFPITVVFLFFLDLFSCVMRRSCVVLRVCMQACCTRT